MQSDVKSTKTISVSEVIYFAYFAVMFGARAVGLYEGMLIYNISLVVGMLLFALKVACTEHTVAEYLAMGALLLLSLLVYYNTGEKGLLLYFTMMLGMKGVLRKRVERLGVVILSVSFTVLIMLSSFGVIADRTIKVSRSLFGKALRHSLGYPYPNTLMTTYIILMLLVFSVIGKQSIKVLSSLTVVFLYGAICLFIFSISRTGLLVSVFYLGLNFYAQCRGKLSKAEKVLINLAYPVCLVIAIVLPYVTIANEKITNMLHNVTHTRWGFSQYYLTNEPITFFGTRFKEVYDGDYPMMIDSSFLYSFLQIGLVAFLIVTGLHMAMIHYHVKRENMTELAIVVSLCLLGLSDPFLFNLSYKNIMFLYIGEVFYLFFAGHFTDGWAGKRICIIPAGKKELQVPKLPETCKGWMEFLIKKSSGLAAGYLVLSVILFLAFTLPTFSVHVSGRIDKVKEWEFVRKGLHAGNWVSAGVIVLVVFVGAKRMKRDC